jgi:hypothetical protein
MRKHCYSATDLRQCGAKATELALLETTQNLRRAQLVSTQRDQALKQQQENEEKHGCLQLEFELPASICLFLDDAQEALNLDQLENHESVKELTRRHVEELEQLLLHQQERKKQVFSAVTESFLEISTEASPISLFLDVWELINVFILSVSSGKHRPLQAGTRRGLDQPRASPLLFVAAGMTQYWNLMSRRDLTRDLHIFRTWAKKNHSQKQRTN